MRIITFLSNQHFDDLLPKEISGIRSISVNMQNVNERYVKNANILWQKYLSQWILFFSSLAMNSDFIGGKNRQ